MAWKRSIFTLVAVLLFFAVVEGILWIAGVDTLLSRRDPFQGFSSHLRVYELDESRSVYRTPPRAVAHSFHYQQFKAEKPENGFRIFVLGGSSAQGFPWGGQFAFARWLGDALRASWPDREFEVINAAAMSYGSHRLRILARELLDYDPDVLVIYGGHNEFVERRFYSDFIDRSDELDFARSLLYRSRLYAAMADLYRDTAVEGRSIDAESATTGRLLGLDVEREYSVDVARAERAEVQRDFEDNLRAILDLARDRQVTVILCTVASNVREWPPNRSHFDEGLDFTQRSEVTRLLAEARVLLERNEARGALSTLRRAEDAAPSYAEVHFLMGRAHELLGHWEDARASYVRARDEDAQPSRVTSTLNETVRRLAAERGVVLVDLERSFELASAHGLVGFNLLEDYVHPKREGHLLIARELWTTLHERGMLGEPSAPDPSQFDLAIAAAAGSGDTTADELNPSWLFNLAVVLEKQGLTDQAIQKYRACVSLDPNYYVAYFNLGRLFFRQGRYAEAAAMYGTALEVRPDYVRGMVGLGESLRRTDRLADAERVLRRAVELDPRSAEAWGSLGGVLSQLGRQVEAETAFRTALGIDPGDAGARTDLGFTLLFQSRFAQAEAEFRASLAQRPDDLRARNGLAAVLTERGSLDEAERIFLENLSIEPDNEFARGGLQQVARRRARSDG